MNNTIECPHCGEDSVSCFAIACWVYADNGQAAEACGDASDPVEGEPAQTAHCSTCDRVFGPPPGFVYRVQHGVPEQECIGVPAPTVTRTRTKQPAGASSAIFAQIEA